MKLKIIISCILFLKIAEAQVDEKLKQEVWSKMCKAMDFDYLTYISNITVNRPNKTFTSTSRVYLKGYDKGLVEVLSPPQDKGFKVLRIEDNFWIFLPSVNKAIRALGKESFVGSDFIHQDILGIDIKKYYELSELKEEENLYLAVLEAKNKELPYYVMKYYLTKEDYLPQKVEFYGVGSEKLIKILEFKKYEKIGKKKLATELICRLAFTKDYETTLKVLSYSTKYIPERVFTKEYLKKGL